MTKKKMSRLLSVSCVCLIHAFLTLNASCQNTTSDDESDAAFIQAGSYGDAATFQVALGDLDGDGDLDAVFANMNAQSEVWLNDGLGGFSNSTQSLGSAAHGVGIGDLDGDGDLDLLFVRASSTMPSSVYLNDGSGTFTPAQDNLDDRDEAANFVNLFDLEGDGDLDAGIYYANRYNTLYVNDGAGRFVQSGPDIPGMACWGDLDGDGDTDAVIQEFEGGYTQLRNAGGGALEATGHVSAPSAIVPGNAALGDIDNDGDLDLVGANGGEWPDTPLTILRNDGSGTLAYDPESRFVTGFGRVALADLDGSGYLDVFVSWYDLPDAIVVNDGLGGFFDSAIRLGSNDWEGATAIGDVDGDGDLDIFVARYGDGGPNTLWLNQEDRW